MWRLIRRVVVISTISAIVTILVAVTPAFADGPIVTPGGGGGAGIVVEGTTGGGGGGGAPSGGGMTEMPAAPAGDPGAAPEVGTTGPPIGCGAAATAAGGCMGGTDFVVVPPTPSAVDIATAVQVAVTAAQIQPIDIGITPEDIPGRTGLVGMPTWLWVKNPSENTIGPIQRTVTTGAVTVNLTAVMTSIVWNMGDGQGVFPCAGPPVAPYTPYVDAALSLPSPTCGYFYRKSSVDQPDGMFHVSATSLWLVFWSVNTPGGGAGGVIPLAPTDRTQIRTGELQVLVQPVP